MAIQDYRYADWLTALAERTRHNYLAESAVKELAHIMENWRDSPANIDKAINTFRPLIVELLYANGEIDKKTYRFANEIKSQHPMKSLTGNPGPFGLQVKSSNGYYFYEPKESVIGPAGEDNTPHHFRKRGAIAGTKAEFDAIGALTDDLLASQRFRAVLQGPVGIVFSFGEIRFLEKIILYPTNPGHSHDLIWFGRSHRDEDWRELGTIDSKDFTDLPKSADGGIILEVAPLCLTDLKIKFPKDDALSLEELRIFGDNCDKSIKNVKAHNEIKQGQ